MNYIFTQSTIFNDTYNQYNYDFCFFNSLIDIDYQDKLIVFTNKPEHYTRYSKYLNIECVEKTLADVMYGHIDFYARHLWVLDYINKHNIENDFVSFLDSRDSYFQTQIFDRIEHPDKLNFYQEDNKFINDWTTPQLERYNHHPDYAKLLAYSDNMINGGSIIGRAKYYKKFIEYSLTKTHELNTVQTTIPFCDQIFFNKLLICDKEYLDYTVCNKPYSLLTSGINPKYFDYNDKQVKVDGKPLHWIHQFDRNDEIKSIILEFYKDRYTFE